MLGPVSANKIIRNRENSDVQKDLRVRERHAKKLATEQAAQLARDQAEEALQDARTGWWPSIDTNKFRNGDIVLLED